MGQDESGTISRLLDHLNSRLAPAVARRGGRVIRLKGDGGLVEFGSAVDALAAAIEFQQAMVEANRSEPEDKAIAFRVGLHLGDVVVEGADIYGDAVNIASRLETEAPSGGIVVSRAVREAVEGRLKATLHALGELNLKNIVRPLRAFRVDWSADDWPAYEAEAGASASISPPAPTVAGKNSQSVVNDLESDKPSIVVLPFKNISGDPEQEYFVDGLVEDIIAALSKLRWFVIAGSTSFTYKGRTVEARQIRRELGVRYVLAGSVRKADGLLRITGEVVDATSGNLIWTDRYEGALENVFSLQDSITLSVVTAISPKMLQAEITRAQAKQTTDLTAYDLYLRAVAQYRDQTPESLLRVTSLLKQAVRLDPNYSAAHGLIALCHARRILSHPVPLVSEEIAEGLEAAKRAVEIGRDNPDALANGGLVIAVLGGRPLEGLIHIERALSLNPNSLGVLKSAGIVFGRVGDHTKAMELYMRAMKISPLDPWAFDTYFGIALLHLFARRFQEARSWADRILNERPNFLPALTIKAAAMGSGGFPAAEVHDVVQKVFAVAPDASIAAVRQRMPGYREVDAEILLTGLRMAGIPEG
jgi:TolB-like protein